VTGVRDDIRLAARGWRWGRRPLVPQGAEPYARPRDRRTFPTAWARTRGAVAVREVVQRYGLAPLLSMETRPRVEGLDVLTGLRMPAVFAANHASHLDTALVLCSLPPAWRRRLAVAAAADYFFDVWWRAVGSALAFNTFPIERRAGALAETPGGLLADGWSLLVFPEGTRSVDGWTGRFHSGAAHLALRHRVPLVPVAIRGTFAAMPRGRGWPVPGRQPVHIRFGPPLPVGADEPAREVTRRLAAAVARLLDEDRTDWWSSLQHAARGETPASTGPPVASWRRTWASLAPPEQARRTAWRSD
jgi:1-acyl-sn-glycerol-3-phosphate acyltransferase